MFPGKVTLLTCPTKISYFFQWGMAVHNTLYRIPWKILQILHSSRKRPVRRHSGWRIGLGNSSAGDWNPSGGLVVLPILGESVFLKDIFRLKHFTMHILQPECRWAGRLRNGWKIWRKNKAFRHVDAVMEKTTGQILKSSCSFNENVLFFFLKALFFSEKNRTFKRLVTCGVTRY